MGANMRLCGAGLSFSVLWLCQATAAGPAVDFAHDIRPILSDNCFQCHGQDHRKRKGELRLDTRTVTSAKENSTRVVTAGKLGESELYRRITEADPANRMPPPDSGKSLSPAQIDLIARWIEQGAIWREHWAFISPKRHAIPAVSRTDWPRNPIDRYVLAHLETEGLQPSEEADRRTLIRRVNFDLTGLPPTPQQVEVFLSDSSPNAYEKVVDRLLDSSHYGEHMGRYWLDAVRYGDTHGLHLDNYREMWPYRDWVINAFNRNLPFDQFATEQIAGDLLEQATLKQQIASGYNRCHISTNEGGSIQEEVYVRNVIDRVETTATIFMGLTVGCAACHDHKYDPLTQKDFYQLFAFFNSLDGSPLDSNIKAPAPVIQVPNAQQKRMLAELDLQITALEARSTDPLPEIDAAQTVWEIQSRRADTHPRLRPGTWHAIGPFHASTHDEAYERDFGPESHPFNLDKKFPAPEQHLAWTQRPDWTDGKVHQDLKGQSCATYLHRRIHSPEPNKATLSLGSNDAVKLWLNGKQIHTHKDSRPAAPDQDIIQIELREGDNELMMKLVNYDGDCGFYFKLTDQPHVPEAILQIIRLEPPNRTTQQTAALRDHYRKVVAKDAPKLKQLHDELAAVGKQRGDLTALLPTTLIMKEAAEPRPAYLLVRGQYDRHGDQVQRSTPDLLPAMSKSLPRNRLGLARWLTDANHPLTARVTVNRFWQQIFGIGIVKTTEDFGSQGQQPSHPALLDHLAVQFIDSSWDVKQLMKRMILSATYRQSSAVTASLLQHDPKNRLLGRGPRFRLDAEMLRDQALTASGLLVRDFGGPSVKPPQPDGLWHAVGYSKSNTVRFVTDKGSKVHRRSIYTFWKRTAPPPQMTAFDAPSREFCVVRRERTNTPLQALLLMNDPQFVEAARNLAQRTLQEGGNSPSVRAAWAFSLVTCRPPSPADLDDLLGAYHDHLETYRNDPDAAKDLIRIGPSQRDPDLDPSELAAWTMVANLILNLDESITKE